jgi:hypothetical protein
VVTHPGLDNALSGLSGQILSEISQQARETLEASFQGKTSVTRRALSPLKAMRDKLDGLSFVDSSFRAVVRDLDRRLATIPVRSPISGGVLDGLRQFLCLAAQPHGLQTWAAQAAPVADGLWTGISQDLAWTTPLNEDAESPSCTEDAESPSFTEDAESPSFTEDAASPRSGEAVAFRLPTPAEAEVINVGGDWFY